MCRAPSNYHAPSSSLTPALTGAEERLAKGEETIKKMASELEELRPLKVCGIPPDPRLWPTGAPA